MEDDEYVHIKALVRGLHGPAKNVSYPHSLDGSSSQANAPLLASIERRPAKIFHHEMNLPLKIPALVITDTDSQPQDLQHHHHHHHHHHHKKREDDDEEPHTPQAQNEHRRFSFGLRRLSHVVFPMIPLIAVLHIYIHFL